MILVVGDGDDVNLPPHVLNKVKVVRVKGDFKPPLLITDLAIFEGEEALEVLRDMAVRTALLETALD